MLTGLLENNPSIRKIVKLPTLYRKIMPMPGNETADGLLRADLERLAVSAPHVLADIGFERDAKACSHDKVAWRRGTHRVTVSITTHKVSVSV